MHPRKPNEFEKIKSSQVKASQIKKSHHSYGMPVLPGGKTGAPIAPDPTQSNR
jgi:hypothetical protein